VSGGGGGVIIIRSLIASGRCTAAEKIWLQRIIDSGEIVLSLRAAIAVAKVAFRVCRRP
jgi:hypothetical protein